MRTGPAPDRISNYMIFAIIAAIVAYRRAKYNGRNGWAWAAAAAGVFIGAQWIVSIGAALILGIGVALFGWDESVLDDTLFIGPVTVVAIGASILATWILLRYLDRPVTDEQSDLPPPPPPTFRGE